MTSRRARCPPKNPELTKKKKKILRNIMTPRLDAPNRYELTPGPLPF